MIKGIIERFQPDEKIRFKTYLNRVASLDKALADDLRESVPKAIQKVYTTYTFKEIMSTSTDEVTAMLGRAEAKANEMAADVDSMVKNMTIDNILNNTSHQMSVVNTNCRVFWEDEPDE